jgi:Sulfotransferase family
VPRLRRVAAGASSRAPTVIYIAGSGRSGSTLLERVLGELPGVVNVGELIDLFRRTAPHGERCGCGRAFADCPFWHGVGERAFEGWDDDSIAAVCRLQRHVARQRHLPRLLIMPLAGRRFRANVARYGACYAELYSAISAEAGAAYIVDASKWPVQALVLFQAGLDIRVIHLVRDVRGVAHSHNKREVKRPHALREGEVMWHQAPAAAAARWVTSQSQAELLPGYGVPVTRMRYEDFVHQPRHAIETALAGLGLPLCPSQSAPIGKGSVVLGRSHGLSGNPSRFRCGVVTLQVDEAWRERMSRRDRFVVTAIGLPLLLRYGWRPLGHSSSRGGHE